MTILNPEIIKKIVCENFDRSAELYEQFEQRFGLFEYLTIKLAEVSHIQNGYHVCDIGCGTGTSSFILQNIIGSEGSVLGVDFSEIMLNVAQGKIQNNEISNLKFLNCDADRLEENIDYPLDSILYNASIFLIPEPKKTLQSAYNILKLGATVGMNYLVSLIGTKDNNIRPDGAEQPGENLFELAKQEKKPFAPYGRRINDPEKLLEILKEIGFQKLKKGTILKEMSLDEIKIFYSIPAQSAALWPKNRYEDRLKLLDSLLDWAQQNGVNRYYQAWGWCVGEK